MKSAGTRILAVFAIASMALLSLAQGAPSQINTALLDLSARLGYSLGIGNLSNWRWEQVSFPNSALGCPTVSGSGGAVLGYRFELTHNATTYDYRVSNDSALVVYCGVIDAATAAAAPEALSQYSNRLCADSAADGPYLRSRINFGMDADVLGGYLNMRAQPSVNAQVLLQLPAGTPLGITAGPECADGYVWWLALANGQTGYIAEAGDGNYFVRPQAPPSLPSREVLNAGLVPYLQEFGRIRGNFLPTHDWSSDGLYLAMPGATGSDSVWVYGLGHSVLEPQFLDFDDGISTLAFRPNHAQLLFGSDSGTLHLWQIEDSGPLIFSERLFLNAHVGPVSALAFSSDGERLASAGHEAHTHVDVDRRFAVVVWDLATVSQQSVHSGHSGLIETLAFSPKNSEFLTIVDGQWLRNWVTYSGDNTFTLDMQLGEPVAFLALDYSRDGELVAVALARPSDNVFLYRYRQVEPLASYQTPTTGVTSLDFSPDGSLLVVGSAEGVFSIWDTESHQLLATREIDGGIYDISFSPDGALIAVSTEKQALVLYGVPLGSG